MSQIMEKTLASLPKLLSQSLIGGGNSKIQQRQLPSMDVQQFMKQIHKARSRSQEAAIVKSQLLSVKQKLTDPNLMSSSNVIRGSFTKIIFCHQLGHDVTDMAIHAMKLAQQGQGFEKRLGYLVSVLLLHPCHELTILMTSTILRDVMSANMTDVCIALKVAGELMGAVSIPILLPEVLRRLTHQQDLVKEKALHCFRCFYQKAPELLEHDISKLKSFLSSRDPGVLMAVMNMFTILTSQKPLQFVGLSTSFVHILNQINSRGFGSVYYYGMVALPWLQISLLKILCNIAQVDANLSTHLEPILKTLIEKTKVSVPISLALLVESIQTATKISSSESLLQLCSRCIMRLMASDSSEDMRYQGLGLLISLSKVKPSYAGQHQAAVMECLSSNDPAIQSRTTFLLHAMANSANVKVICGKLFEQHGKSNDRDFQREILEMIHSLVEKFASDIEWYVATNFCILSHDRGVPFKDRIADSLLKKLRQFYEHTEISDSSGLANTLELMLSSLEMETHLNPEYAVRIQILGVLIPLVPHQFQVERFFNIITPFVFKDAAVCDTNAKAKNVMMNAPRGFADGQRELCGLIQDDEETKIKCVETAIKLVLAKCLDAQVVLQWLEKNDYRGQVQNGCLRGVFRDLEDLVMQPSSINIKSQIVFHAKVSDLDLSLSFLDGLIVQDLLNGGDCYKPKYTQEAERSRQGSTSQITSSLEGNLDENPLSMPSLARSLSSEKEKVGTVRKTKGRWRDDDGVNDWDISEDGETEEQFLFVDAETSANMETDKNKRELAEQLFAGLDASTTTEPGLCLSDSGISSSGTKGPMKSPRNIWDDDCDDDASLPFQQNNTERKSSFFKMDLHPFGISKKGTSKPAIWHDGECTDSLQTQANIPKAKALDLENVSILNKSAETSVYDEQDTPSYTPTYLYHQADADSVDSSGILQDGMSVEQETGLSIYSELTDIQSPVLISPDIAAVSTMDTLTDSDPEGT